MTLWLAGFGLVSGVTTYLFGFGGGFFTVPLIYILLMTSGESLDITYQNAMQIAVATSLCVMFFSSVLATRRHYYAGRLSYQTIRPFMGALAVGAVAGAVSALSVNGQWIRGFFIVYLLITIIDCCFRPGFIAKATVTAMGPKRSTDAVAGAIIGFVAAFLGVGGSVMTVPLMRRRGFPMAVSAAMASAFTLPVAAAGLLTFMLFSSTKSTGTASGYIGYIWYHAAIILLLSSWLGMRIAEPLLSRISDSWHARLYPFLLVAVLILMSVPLPS
ncbi:sulfite exporter TauE/SafE family protein [Biostraticola tofi]|uniref:Probable membrane transporter protein n=1 Tax=Biostraticola tofi TaxID=466109 RepID=A0A4R3YMD1_9GAMM|nr:sulfite exporter TauE/SafE family protein [Biostraticola tofi]TCV92648.1 hypothetical protein EDC52_11197 [Biostraticola tofi]